MSFFSRLKDSTIKLTTSIKDRVEFEDSRLIELDVHEFKSVNVKAFNGSIELKIHEENTVRLESKVAALSTTLSEEELKKEFTKKSIIRVTKNSITVNANQDKNLVINLVISIPIQELNSLKFDGTNCKFLFNENGRLVDVKTIEVSALNGKASIYSVNSEVVNVGLKSGDIEISGILGNAKLKTLNGNVIANLYNEIDSMFQASIINGSIILGVNNDIGLRGKLNTNIGTLEVNVDDCEVTGDIEQKLLKMKSVKKEAKNKITFLCETRKGDVTIGLIEGSEG